MPPRTLGNRGPATPAPQQQPAHRPAAAPAPAVRGGSGLPPPPPGWTPHQGGGGFSRKTDKEWEAEPLRDGTHEFDVYVTKVIVWNSGGVTVTLRVSAWDAASNRSLPDHGRPLRFDQQPRKSTLDAYLADPNDEKARDRYCRWRHDIVTAYTDCGFPEETWGRDDVGPVPPWDRFFVQVVGGVAVPVMLRAKVRAWSMRGDGGRFSTPFHGLDVQSLSVIRDDKGRPYQAMLPREVPPGLANLHRWTVAETKTIGDNLAVVALLDKDCVTFPHNGLPTYKDL